MYTTGIHCQDTKFTTGVLESVRRLGTVRHMNNNIRLIRMKRGMTQIALANAIGTSRGMLIGLEKGEKKLYQKWLEKISHALECTPEQLISPNKSKMIPVVGSVGAGGQIFPIDDLPLTRVLSESEQVYMNCDFVEAPPESGHEETVAVRIEGDSMLPYFANGTILYYNGRESGDLIKYINKLCVVMLKDGHAMFKILKRGTAQGFYTLASHNALDIENVQIEWCAKVIFIKPV